MVTGDYGTSGVEGNDSTNTPRYSSSPELSSPPRSLSDPDSPAAQQLSIESLRAPNSAKIGDGQWFLHPVRQFLKRRCVAAPEVARKKPGRKPANKTKVAADGTNVVDAPKVRKPRKPKDPNAPPPQRKKKAADAKADPKAAARGTRQPKITEMSIRPSEPTFSLAAAATLASQNGKSEDIAKPSNSFFSHPAPPAPPPPTQARTSGQNYDPIRSNYDPVRETVSSQTPFGNSQVSPRPPIINRASASPSISSLVDPPNQSATPPALASQSFFSYSHHLKKHKPEGPTSVPASPNMNRLAPSPMMNTITLNNQTSSLSASEQPSESWMRASAPPIVQPHLPSSATIQSGKTASPVVSSSTVSSSTTQSPRPSKTVDITPPPLPGSGNGLMFNGPKDGTDSRAPTIVLHIPMNGETNKYVNFTRLAEERYGWDALHPRLAAQRERLARVAAAGAALEKSGSNKESGDEMSLDLSEGEGSNVEMGGMSDGRTGTDGGVKKPVKKRKTKEDEYDKDDGFVDDSELLWEEQAAASKDGFFVYSGPLVPEGEKPVLERAEGTGKRGRGTGRVRGTATGRTSAANRSGAAGTSGPGSRGGAAPRKPRITKAERARMLEEKNEREKLGSVAKAPNHYNGMSQLASAASMGGTPMVFN
ncbi:MAG: hypothetical protein M1818_007857 [Claussenomyces sp. TS43310]|nr:MAG: hypothetical protein M1818_007857 [Claussenomyces sp. TS43310]